MAWGFIGELPISRDQYDRLNGEIKEDPDGLILHTASEHGGGMRIIDVWESEDAWTRFRDERLGPAIAKVVGPDAMAQGPPPLDAMDVHNMELPGS